MVSASQEFKASSLFLQSLPAGIKSASAALARLKLRSLLWNGEGHCNSGAIAAAPKKDSSVAPNTLTPKSASTVVQLPSSILRKQPSMASRALTPTPRSCVSFHMPEAEDEQDDLTPAARSPFGKRLSSADRETFGLLYRSIEHCSIDGITLVDVDAETPTPKRSCSIASVASVASQGPCHMVLHVDSTPKDSVLNGASTPGLDETKILSFGI